MRWALAALLGAILAGGASAPPSLAQAPQLPCYNAIKADGKPGCLPVPPQGALDVRSFGVGPAVADNAPLLQQAVDAAYGQGVALVICGGVLNVAGPVYYYGGMTLAACPGTWLKKTAGGFAALSSADAVGAHWVTTTPGPRGVTLRGLNIDNNYQSGAAIVASGLRASEFVDLNLINGAGPGTWSYQNSQGTGTAPNALLELISSPKDNTSSIRILGGVIGNANTQTNGPPYDYTNCQNMSDIGIALVNPSQNTGYSNPPNYNLVRNTQIWCNNTAIRNDYASDNVFDMVDASFSGKYCVSIGDVGQSVFVAGTSTAGGVLSLKFTNPAITGSPVLAAYTSTGAGPAADAAGLAAAVNGNAALTAFGIAAQTTAGTGNITVTYSPTQSLPITPGASGGTNLGLVHTAQRNVVSGLYCEGSGLATTVWLGANAAYNSIRNPANYNPGSGGLLVAAARFGSSYTRVSGHLGGTIKSASFTADCLNDPQPYLVDTTAGPVTATLLGPADLGAQCSFSDYNNRFATNNLTIAVAPGWGQTIQGAAAVVLNVNGATQSWRLSLATTAGVLNWVPVSSGPP